MQWDQLLALFKVGFAAYCTSVFGRRSGRDVNR